MKTNLKTLHNVIIRRKQHKRHGIMRRLHFMTFLFFHRAKLTCFQNKRYTFPDTQNELYSYMNCCFVFKMLIFNPI